MTVCNLRGNRDGSGPPTVGSHSARTIAAGIDVQVAIGERTGHVYMVSRVDDDVRHHWHYEVAELPDERVEVHLLRAVKVSPEPAFAIDFNTGASRLSGETPRPA